MNRDQLRRYKLKERLKSIIRVIGGIGPVMPSSTTMRVIDRYLNKYFPETAYEESDLANIEAAKAAEAEELKEMEARIRSDILKEMEAAKPPKKKRPAK